LVACNYCPRVVCHKALDTCVRVHAPAEVLERPDTFFICPRCHVRWQATVRQETPYKVRTHSFIRMAMFTTLSKGLVVRGRMWEGDPAILTEAPIDPDFHGLFAPNMAVIQISIGNYQSEGNPASMMNYMLSAYYPESSPSSITFLAMKLKFNPWEPRSLEGHMGRSNTVAEKLSAYAPFLRLSDCLCLQNLQCRSSDIGDICRYSR
jgi:hypothetical protein